MYANKKIALFIPDLKFSGYKDYFSRLRQLVKETNYSLHLHFIGYSESTEIQALIETNPEDYEYILVFSNRLYNYLERGYKKEKIIVLEKEVESGYANIYIDLKQIVNDIVDRLLRQHYTNIFLITSSQLNNKLFNSYLEENVKIKIPYASITSKVISNEQISRIAISLFNNLLVPEVVITDSYLLAENINIIRKRLYPGINMAIICPTSVLSEKFLNFYRYEVDYNDLAMHTFNYIYNFKLESFSLPLIGFGDDNIESSESFKVLSTNNIFIEDFKRVENDFRIEFNCSLNFNLVSIDELFTILSSPEDMVDFDLIVLPYLWKNKFKEKFAKIGYYDSIVNDDRVLLYNYSKDVIIYRNDIVTKYNLKLDCNDYKTSLMNFLKDPDHTKDLDLDAMPLYFKDFYSIGKTFSTLYFINDKEGKHNFYEGEEVNSDLILLTIAELEIILNYPSKKLIESSYDKFEEFFKNDTLTVVIDYNFLEHYLRKFPNYAKLITIYPYLNTPYNYTGLALSKNSSKIELGLKLIGRLEKVSQINHQKLLESEFQEYIDQNVKHKIAKVVDSKYNDFEVNVIIGTAIKNYLNGYFDAEQVVIYINRHLKKSLKTN